MNIFKRLIIFFITINNFISQDTISSLENLLTIENFFIDDMYNEKNLIFLKTKFGFGDILSLLLKNLSYLSNLKKIQSFSEKLKIHMIEDNSGLNELFNINDNKITGVQLWKISWFCQAFSCDFKKNSYLLLKNRNNPLDERIYYFLQCLKYMLPELSKMCPGLKFLLDGLTNQLIEINNIFKNQDEIQLKNNLNNFIAKDFMINIKPIIEQQKKKLSDLFIIVFNKVLEVYPVKNFIMENIKTIDNVQQEIIQNNANEHFKKFLKFWNKTEEIYNFFNEKWFIKNKINKNNLLNKNLMDKKNIYDNNLYVVLLLFKYFNFEDIFNLSTYDCIYKNIDNFISGDEVNLLKESFLFLPIDLNDKNKYQNTFNKNFHNEFNKIKQLSEMVQQNIYENQKNLIESKILNKNENLLPIPKLNNETFLEYNDKSIKNNEKFIDDIHQSSNNKSKNNNNYNSQILMVSIASGTGGVLLKTEFDRKKKQNLPIKKNQLIKETIITTETVINKN